MQIGLSLAITSPRRGAGFANAYAATIANVMRDRVVYDSDMARGNNAASVPLSGTTDAPDGTAILARAVSVDDGGATSTAWVEVATAADGAWSGTLSVPRSSSWYRAQAKVEDSGAAAAQTTDRFGSGLVVLYGEQSNMARLFLENYTTPETIGSNGDNFQYIEIENRGAPATPDTGTISAPAFVTDASSETAALKAMAATFHKNAPGLKVAALFDVKTGEPQEATLRTSLTERLFENVVALTAAGTQPGIFVQSHPNAHPGTREWFAGSSFGLTPAGDAIAGIDTAAEFASVTVAGEAINHVWAEAMPGLLTGRTQMLMAPSDWPSKAEALPVADPDRTWAGLADDFPTQVIDTPWAGAVLRADNVDFSDATHFARWSIWGMPLRASRLAAFVLDAIESPAFGQPVIDGITWTADYVELTSSAGALTTYERAMGGTTNYPDDPIGAPGTPGTSEVVGFQFANGDPARAAIVDASGNSATAGRIRVYPASGTFDGTSRLWFGTKGIGRDNTDPAYGAPGASDANALVKHMAIVDVGLSGNILQHGWPVRTATHEAINDANALPSAEAFTSVSAGDLGVVATRGWGVPTAFTFETRFRSVGDNRPYLLNIHPAGYWSQVYVYNGNLRVQLRNASNVLFFNGTITVAELGVDFTDGFYTLRVAVDLVAGRIDAFVDDVAVNSTPGTFGDDTTFAPGEGFSGGRVPQFMQTGSADIVYASLWLEYATGGATPAGPVHFGITADGSGGFDVEEP